MSDTLEAFHNVDFDWVRSLDSIWSDSDALTGAPNEALVQSVAARFFQETRPDVAHPRGGVLVGQSGIGKTHLVGLLRKEVWRRVDGSFCWTCWASRISGAVLHSAS
jgi:DNA replication protein DnaC